MSPIELAMISPRLQGLHAPIVEDSSTTIHTREALGVHTFLAELLSSIHHYRVGAQGSSHNHSRFGTHASSAEEATGDALLVVVLQEIEHTVTDIIHLLPLESDTFGRPVLASHTTQVVVHTDFVVEVVKSCCEVIAVESRIIYFGNEKDIGIFLFHLFNRPCPELDRHHFCHITTEAIDLLACPEEQDMQHLVPSVRNRVKLLFSATLVEDAIVEFDSLVPVVDRWVSREAIVARSTSRVLLVVLDIELRCELLT